LYVVRKFEKHKTFDKLNYVRDMLGGAQDLRVIIQRGYALHGEVLKNTHLPANAVLLSRGELSDKNTLCDSRLYVVRKFSDQKTLWVVGCLLYEKFKKNANH
jgi:hypothetical protein